MTWLFLMKNRSKLLYALQIFYKEVKTQFGHKVCILRSDNAKEYLSTSSIAYFSQKGILHQTSCSYTLQQNGVAERKNQHLLDVTRALLFYIHVPKHFWSDYMLTVCYLINRMPSSVLNSKTPH